MTDFGRTVIGNGFDREVSGVSSSHQGMLLNNSIIQSRLISKNTGGADIRTSLGLSGNSMMVMPDHRSPVKVFPGAKGPGGTSSSLNTTALN